MKFKASNVIWGLGFIIVGILLYCKAFLGWDISIWSLVWRFWPVIIILSSLSGMFKKGFNMSSLIWLLIGVTFLLLTNNLVSTSLIRKLIVPASLVIIGIAMIFKDALAKNNTTGNTHTYDYSQTYEKNNTENFTYTTTTENTNNTNNSDDFFRKDSTSQKKPEYNAIFSSNEVRYPNEIFTGTCINSVFGSVVLDLREAIITEDVVINASVVFAGADIYVPANVNIKVSSIPIFGGVSNKTLNQNANGPTIFINATCMFGGLDIK